MTANKMLDTALKMLGYSEANGNTQLTKRIQGRALVFINLVYSDLWDKCKDVEYKQITALKDEINLPERVLVDVFPYGLAMFIAQSESDGDQQAIWARLYNQKRISLSNLDTVKDVIPKVW